MDNSDGIFAIYRELMGYLSQIPLPKDAYETVDENSGWERVNQAIDDLEKLTGKDFERFRIKPVDSYGGGQFTKLMNLRSSLGGLINKLHAEYFSSLSDPFGSVPSTVMTNIQTQEQTQESHIQLVVDLTSKIAEALQKPNISPQERDFLSQVKSGVSKAKSALELISLILSTGAALGLTAAQIASLLK